jgi:hypothetical protein
VTRSAFTQQIQNRNFLSPVGFKFTITKAPKVAFFCQQAGLPELSLGIANQPSYLKDINVPGEKLEYGDLTISFLVDENLENYMSIHNWLLGLGFPETPQQFKDLVRDEDAVSRTNNDIAEPDYGQQFSDGSLIILTSHFNPAYQVRFKDLFPYSLSGLDFDATVSDAEYFTAQASFKYTYYTITDMSGSRLTTDFVD